MSKEKTQQKNWSNPPNESLLKMNLLNDLKQIQHPSVFITVKEIAEVIIEAYGDQTKMLVEELNKEINESKK